MSTETRILFVCTGNLCRSPMAAVYFRHLCEERELEDVSVKSAGVAALNGEPMSRQALLALAAQGLDGSGERSQSLSRDLVDWADRIIVMTGMHEESLKSHVPGAGAKVRKLMSLVGDAGDVPDPFGGTVEQYKTCLAKMIPPLQALADRLSR